MFAMLIPNVLATDKGCHSRYFRKGLLVQVFGLSSFKLDKRFIAFANCNVHAQALKNMAFYFILYSTTFYALCLKSFKT